jgi:hypothetical protein
MENFRVNFYAIITEEFDAREISRTHARSHEDRIAGLTEIISFPHSVYIISDHFSRSTLVVLVCCD